MLTKNKYIQWLGLVLISCSLTAHAADTLDNANRLLKITRVGDRFEAAIRVQARDIVRTYSIIVASQVDVDLPIELTQRIEQCYTQVYAWRNFSSGIAKVLADNLSPRELEILIGFYSDQGLPPTEIENFKNTITKAELIQLESVEFIFQNSASCVDRDAVLIHSFLANLSAPLNPIISSIEPDESNNIDSPLPRNIFSAP